MDRLFGFFAALSLPIKSEVAQIGMEPVALLKMLRPPPGQQNQQPSSSGRKSQNKRGGKNQDPGRALSADGKLFGA